MVRPKRSHSPRRRAAQVNRRKRLRRLANVILCLALLVGGGVMFYEYLRNASHFRVRTLRVEGMRYLDEETVRAVAGVTAGDNVLFLDIRAVQARVEAIPYVKSCKVRRDFPDRVVISFVEREPVATVLLNSHLFEIDREGVLLREVDSFAPHPGPFITNVPGLAYVEPGDQLDEQALRRALDVWEAFRGLPMSEEVTVSEIAARSANEILMFCDNLSYEIRWGRADVRRQARNLDIFWRAQRGQAVCGQYLDLRFDDEIVCR